MNSSELINTNLGITSVQEGTIASFEIEWYDEGFVLPPMDRKLLMT